ncbi:MAG: ComEC/Rec2 family competence protein [Ilumatobacteraceae bacterium]
MALVVVGGVWVGEQVTASEMRWGVFVLAVLGGLGVIARSRLRAVVTASMLLLLLASVAAGRSAAEWRAVSRFDSGPFEGVVQLVSDPQPMGAGRKFVTNIDGDRFQSVVYGGNATFVSALSAGDWVFVRGVRRDVDERGRRRMQTRHVVGVLDVAAIGFPEGGVDARTRVLERTANDMRSLLSRGASVMRSEDSALFRGLVYGDDADQSVDTVNAFRASGLAHLTAVSGQNVGYLLTVLGPFLRRRERWARVIITLSALGWFAVLTRLEPSVVRAAGMAAISALSMALGWRARALDVLSLCVVVFVMVDPFLVWSVGWWLSVGGTLGLITLTPFIHRLVRGTDGRHRRLADWVAPTIAAQAGVLPVSFAVFGWPNALSVPANLLAAPVAGLVMLVGFPAAMLAGLVPVLAEPLMFFPSLAVRWVALVAAVASRWRPPDMVNVIGIVLIPLTLWMVGRTSRHRCANLG